VEFPGGVVELVSQTTHCGAPYLAAPAT
jgi:hypothetical protein